MSYTDAYELAEEAARVLRPTVELLKCVGSLRRQRTTIGDIEFLTRPHSSSDLFGGPAIVHLDEVRAAMHEIGTWVRGGPRMMQITDLLGRKRAHLELYVVHPVGCDCKDCNPWGPAQWGSVLAIRTGPEDLGRYCVTRMRSLGFRHQRGQVRRIGSDELHPTESEESFFAVAGVECRPPKDREAQAAGLWAAYRNRRRS